VRGLPQRFVHGLSVKVLSVKVEGDTTRAAWRRSGQSTRYAVSRAQAVVEADALRVGRTAR
jgi:hypothetical protein